MIGGIWSKCDEPGCGLDAKKRRVFASTGVPVYAGCAEHWPAMASSLDDYDECPRCNRPVSWHVSDDRKAWSCEIADVHYYETCIDAVD